MKRSSAMSYLLVGLFLAGSGTWEEARGQTGFFIINANSGKCLDAADRYAHAPVVQYRCHGGENQQWNFGPEAISVSGDGDYTQIQDVRSGLCLDIPSFSQNNNARLQLFPCEAAGNNQFFARDSVIPSSQLMRIRALHSGKCLDVPNASQSDGVPIQQFTCHSGLNQQWVLIPAF